MKSAFLFVLAFSLTCYTGIKAQENRWQINQSGGISWQVGKNNAHKDHIEMSGKYI